MSKNLMIRETYVNETKGYQYGDSGWYESYTDSKGELFRSCQKEFGRCVSAMHCDTASGTIENVGWVFQKRQEYSDYRGRGDRYYIQETWVEVAVKVEHKTTVTHH